MSFSNLPSFLERSSQTPEQMQNYLQELSENRSPVEREAGELLSTAQSLLLSQEPLTGDQIQRLSEQLARREITQQGGETSNLQQVIAPLLQLRESTLPDNTPPQGYEASKEVLSYLSFFHQSQEALKNLTHLTSLPLSDQLAALEKISASAPDLPKLDELPKEIMGQYIQPYIQMVVDQSYNLDGTETEKVTRLNQALNLLPLQLQEKDLCKCMKGDSLPLPVKNPSLGYTQFFLPSSASTQEQQLGIGYNTPPAVKDQLMQRLIALTNESLATILNRNGIELKDLFEVTDWPSEREPFEYIHGFSENFSTASWEKFKEVLPLITRLDLRGIRDRDLIQTIFNGLKGGRLKHLHLEDNPIQTIPSHFSNIETLHIEGCHAFNHLPEGLHSLKKISIFRCSQLKDLSGNLQSCTHFTLISCDNFETLKSNLENCTHFTLSYCDKFETLNSNLKNCTHFNLHSCKKFETLNSNLENCTQFKLMLCRKFETLNSSLENCTQFEVKWCDKFENLNSNLKNCSHFTLESCGSLQSLTSSLKNCSHFTLESCGSLQSLTSSLENCSHFTLESCGSLQSLTSSLENCTQFIANSCPNLTWGPNLNLTQCTQLEIRQSPQLIRGELPQLPPSVIIIGLPQHNSWSLTIPMEDISQDPFKYLLQLHEHIKTKGSFPVIYFVDPDGRPSPGIDAGGLKKELITRLIGAISKLHNGLDPSLPTFSKLERKKLQALAGILARCLEGPGIQFTTGLAFSPVFYRTLCSHDRNSPPTIEESLQILALPHSLTTWAKSERKPSEEEVNCLSNLFDEEMSFKTLTPQEIEDWCKAKKGRSQALQEALTNQLKERGYFERESVSKAVGRNLFSSRRFQSLTDEKKASLKNSPQALKEAIEGVLTPTALLEALDWEADTNHETGEVLNIEELKNWLKEWVLETESLKEGKEKLRRFVRLITAQDTLPSEAKIIIRVLKYDPEKTPSAHTCFNTLDLPQYPTKENFLEILEAIIALSDDGFSAA